MTESKQLLLSVMIKLNEDEELGSQVEENEVQKIEVEESEKSKVVEESGFSLTMENMSSSIAMSLQWMDKICGITPSSKRGQLIYMLAMLLIPLIPIFALVTQNVILLNDIITKKADLIESDLSVEKSDATARFIAALQQERSASLMTLFLREDFNSITKKINFDIASLRLMTDTALENITEWRAFTGEDMFRSKLRSVYTD